MKNHLAFFVEKTGFPKTPKFANYTMKKHAYKRDSGSFLLEIRLIMFFFYANFPQSPRVIIPPWSSTTTSSIQEVTSGMVMETYNSIWIVDSLGAVIMASKKMCELFATALSTVVEYPWWNVNERYDLVKKGVSLIKRSCPKTKIVKMRLQTMEQDLESGPDGW